MKSDYSDVVTPPGMLLEVGVSGLGLNLETESTALIDTGADITVVPVEKISELGLRPRGYQRIRGVMDAEFTVVPTYYITLKVSRDIRFDAKVVSLEVKHLLIGRDILNQLILYADGPNKSFELKAGRGE